MRGTPPALQIAAENFPPRVARSESGELSKDRHRPSNISVIPSKSNENFADF